MKTMNENTEIGELLKEITESGWIEFRTDIYDEPNGERIVTVDCTKANDEDSFTVTSDSLVGVLRLIVDAIRQSLGKPPREAPLKFPALSTGRCKCGCPKPLIIERSMEFHVSWTDGGITGTVPALKFYPEPGEIGTCPDCGRRYTF